jgi:hypothetical protein
MLFIFYLPYRVLQRNVAAASGVLSGTCYLQSRIKQHQRCCFMRRFFGNEYPQTSLPQSRKNSINEIFSIRKQEQSKA